MRRWGEGEGEQAGKGEERGVAKDVMLARALHRWVMDMDLKKVEVLDYLEDGYEPALDFLVDSEMGEGKKGERGEEEKGSGEGAVNDDDDD
jgi:hypothetical protein